MLGRRIGGKAKISAKFVPIAKTREGKKLIANPPMMLA
jgi:hypothetical protein